MGKILKMKLILTVGLLVAIVHCGRVQRDNASEMQKDRAATDLVYQINPCPQKWKGYFCHVDTKRSFGCGFGLHSYCWRSCDAAKEENCKVYDWCAVDVGTCKNDKNCEVGVHAPCWYQDM